MPVSDATNFWSGVFATDHALRIRFCDGEVFELSNFAAADEDGKWSAVIVELQSDAEPHRKRLFRPGSGLDFRTAEVSEIVDVASRRVLFQR